MRATCNVARMCDVYNESVCDVPRALVACNRNDTAIRLLHSMSSEKEYLNGTVNVPFCRSLI